MPSNKIANLRPLCQRHEFLILEIYYALIALAFLIPERTTLRYPLYFIIALIWLRELFFSKSLTRWAAGSAGNGVLYIILCSTGAAGVAALLNVLFPLANKLLDTAAEKAQTFFVLIGHLGLQGYLAVIVINGVILGLLISALAHQKATILNALRRINPALFVASAYLFIDHLSHYHRDDLSLLMIRGVSLALGLLLGVYNWIKLNASGATSRSYYLLIIIEFVFYLQSLLLRLFT